MTKKICIVTAGGTIGMIRDLKTGSLVPAKNPLEFLKNFPDISNIGDFHLEPVINMDSSNMQTTDWT
jgi:L-asparaginase/Glu-tRNA(Gln) amidotransferase subunit D